MLSSMHVKIELFISQALQIHHGDETLSHIFKIFWNRHLLSWLERQWCLKGLQSCFIVLYAVQSLAKVCIIREPVNK
jgi:hypothetical protein